MKGCLSGNPAHSSGGDAASVSIQFEIAPPPSARLDVYMIRKGLGCMAGSLAYAMMLRKHIAAEVSFRDNGSSPPMSRRPANSTPEGTSCAFPH